MWLAVAEVIFYIDSNKQNGIFIKLCSASTHSVDLWAVDTPVQVRNAYSTNCVGVDSNCYKNVVKD